MLVRHGAFTQETVLCETKRQLIAVFSHRLQSVIG